jgi:hypothetical protein
MKLQDIVQPADILFLSGDNWISRSIQKVTFSDFSHVGIIYDKDTMFETDIKWGKASLRDIEKYNDNKVIIMRPVGICQAEYIQKLCIKYNNTPYSFVDILTNFFLSPFNNTIRRKVVSWIGTKRFAICSELTARIYFEASKLAYLGGYEGYTPQDLFEICINHPEHFQVVLDQISDSIPPTEE